MLFNHFGGYQVLSRVFTLLQQTKHEISVQNRHFFGQAETVNNKFMCHTLQ